MTGHRSPITTVDHHHETGLTVTGGYDGRVLLWREEEEIWATAFADLINDVRFSSDATQIAVSVADRYCYLLDSTTGEIVDALGPHGDDVNAARWLGDDTGLVCVSDHLDPVVRVWRHNDHGWNDVELVGHASGVFAVAVSPDGASIATAAEDGTARIWSLDNQEQLHVLEHPGDPETIDWSPDGMVIATGCDDAICRLWNAESGELVRTLDEARAAVRFCRFSTDGRRLLVGSYDAVMRDYDTDNFAVVASYEAAFQWERAAVHTRHGVLVGSFAAEPIVHGPAEQKVTATFGINHVSQPHDGSTYVALDSGEVVRLTFDPEHKVFHQAETVATHRSIVNTVALANDGATLASGDYRGNIAVVDTANGECKMVENTGGPINSIVWDLDSRTFFSAGYDGEITRFDRMGNVVSNHKAHNGPIKSLAMHDASKTLIAGSSDGTITAWRGDSKRWEAADPSMILVNAVAVSDNGIVASASRDLTVRIWGADDGQLIEELPTLHRKSIKSIAISSDGRTIVTGAYDTDVVLWRQRDHRWTATILRGHTKPGVASVKLFDGFVVSAGWDGRLAIWEQSGPPQAISYWSANDSANRKPMA